MPNALREALALNTYQVIAPHLKKEANVKPEDFLVPKPQPKRGVDQDSVDAFIDAVYAEVGV